MKKSALIILLCLFIFTAAGCQSNSANNHAKPESLYHADNSIDLFVYENVAYVNAHDVGWVAALDLEKMELLGAIRETGTTSDFDDWDATVLEVGSNIYQSGRPDILLAESNGFLIPYLKYVEG